MKYIFKYIIFFFLSLRRDKQYIILNPNLSFLGLKKIFIFDKKKKKFFNYKIRDKYDFITVEEIYFHECYKINNLKIFDEIDIFTKSKKLLIVDCGSNIGCSTNYFLNNYSNSKIISIEPDKKNFEFLKKNVQSNNAILVNNAISSEEIGFEILDSNDNRAKSIIISKDNQLSPKALTINQILDDENNTNYEPFLIKIDIEGHESDLFKKNTEWFDKFKVIIIEIHDWMLPGKSISRNYFNTLSEAMKKNNRDVIIRGENLISIKL